MNTIKVVTYNIHKCVGIDRRYSPERIVDVLREIDADIIAMQEVVCHRDLHRRDNQAEFIAKELGFNFCVGENRQHRGGGYGNATLSRFPIERHRNFDITVARREPRGLLWSEMTTPGGPVHLANVHMGTSFFERRKQVHKMLAGRVLDAPELRGRRILAGDFNEWINGLTTKLLRANFQSIDPKLHLGRSRTFPGVLPMVHLDHVYYDDHFRLRDAFLQRSRKAFVASDHLPIVAEFDY